MYFAKRNQVWYYHDKVENADLFLTVHPTTGVLTVEAQAIILARKLNEEIP